MLDCEPTLCHGILLSDKVIREAGTGKISLINCFTHFNVPGFPFLTPPFYVTVFLTNLRGKIEGIDITVRIEDKGTGHVLNSVSGHIGINPEAPQLEPHIVINIPLPMPPINIPVPGIYVIKVLVNNEEIGERPIKVSPITASLEQGEG
jgi:hypothetical protein